MTASFTSPVSNRRQTNGGGGVNWALTQEWRKPNLLVEYRQPAISQQTRTNICRVRK